MLGKQALLTMPSPSPFRYRMLSGGGAVAVLHQSRVQLVNGPWVVTGPCRARGLRMLICMAGSTAGAWLRVSALEPCLPPGLNPA